jgi:Undecaprenyl-phosphate glucose phosphotransferase
MIKQRSQILCAWFMFWDIALTGLAWFAAYYLRFEAELLPITKTPPDFEHCLNKVPLVLILAAVAYRLARQYEVHRLGVFFEEALSVIKGVALLSLLVMGGTFYLHDSYESRASMLIFSALTVVALLVMRRASWSAVRWLRSRGYNQAFALIVGTGKIARATARVLRRSGWIGIKPIGFIEDEPTDWSGDLDILGKVEDMPALIKKYRISYVFICLPMNRAHDTRQVFEKVSDEFVEVRLVADLPDLSGVSLALAPLDDLTMISLRESPHFGLNLVIKRVMDIGLSLFGLFILSPLLLLIAALVKLTSKGPVFYVQERCGLNGRSFKMLKFRSMRVDAEVQTGAVWANKDDPRKTKLGDFLRKTSLDELPQLFNVLMGDMSLVGPRPERPVFIQKFRKTIPSYMARHAVKCGITGWAQVHGWRGNTSLRKRVQYDLYYINHWTPWLDIRILWLTVFKGFIHRNAY